MLTISDCLCYHHGFVDVHATTDIETNLCIKFYVQYAMCKILLLLVRNCCGIKSEIVFMYDVMGIHNVITL